MFFLVCTMLGKKRERIKERGFFDEKLSISILTQSEKVPIPQNCCI